ncbi:MAG TPA: sulfite exporter TauE/SafE family protein [Pirellulales bacterium]|jgi:hypothetical protein|nr:sulfite exporter TauE/SafE family protein [Pirellulales bacterium]
MTVQEYLLLCAVAAVAGAINSVAGGGTLLTFPALQAALAAAAGTIAGVESPAEAAVVANATSTVALVPASLAALGGYRQEFVAVRRWALWLVAPSFVGGAIGSLLLTNLPAETFAVLIPWLILVAATLFALQPAIARWTGIGNPHDEPSGTVLATIIVFQTLVAVYGGYFGAGIGILMLSSLAFMGLADIHSMNALKNLLGTCINGTAVVVFVAAGKVYWPLAIAMAVASTLGGYASARVARRMNRNVVRWIVATIGFSLATYYFARRFG